jgi:polyhydroxyalkanoate synthesis repressor PhaR
MARVIKKYANRKLYDTSAKKYLRLTDIAKLVERGETVQVIDNDTKQDITSVVLSSIILESTKKDTSRLPDTMLAGLIQKRGEEVMKVVKESVAAGVSMAGVVQEEVEKRVKEAIKKGKEQADSLAAIGESLESLLKDFIARIQKNIEETVEKNVARLVASMNIPTKTEIDRLEAAVTALSRQVEALTKRQTSRKKSKAKAKPARAKKK